MENSNELQVLNDHTMNTWQTWLQNAVMAVFSVLNQYPSMPECTQMVLSWSDTSALNIVLRLVHQFPSIHQMWKNISRYKDQPESNQCTMVNGQRSNQLCRIFVMVKKFADSKLRVLNIVGAICLLKTL